MAKGYEQQQYEKQLSEAASLLAGEVPAGKERDYLIELSRRFKPEPWIDGALYRVRIAGGERYVTWSESEGNWALGGDDFGSLVEEGDAQEVEPLRVLSDDEIAVERVWKGFGPGSWRAEARNMQPHAAAILCNAYADALEAEAGA